MIEKLSSFFGVSINDILSGKISEPENQIIEAEKNIVDVMKSSNKIKMKWQIIAFVLSIVVLFAGIFGLYKVVTSSKEEVYKSEIKSQEAFDIFSEINNVIFSDFYCSKETVVISSRIDFNVENRIDKITMDLWDCHSLKYIKVIYSLFTESKTYDLFISATQNSGNLDTDGIPLYKFSKMISTQNVSEIIELSGNSADFGYSIDFDNQMFKTVEENRNVGILPSGYSYIYLNNDIVPFTNLNQTEGKVFEIAVFTKEETDDKYSVNTSCCLIHIPR